MAAWRAVAEAAARTNAYVPLAETRVQLVAGQRLHNGVVMQPYGGYDVATAGTPVGVGYPRCRDRARPEHHPGAHQRAAGGPHPAAPRQGWRPVEHVRRRGLQLASPARRWSSATSTGSPCSAASSGRSASSGWASFSRSRETYRSGACQALDCAHRGRRDRRHDLVGALVAGGNAIRGTRVGAGPMGEAERGEAAPRRRIPFCCANGHETRIAFASEADVPELWDCPRCGLPGRPGPAGPAAGAAQPSPTRPTSPTCGSGAATPTATRCSRRRSPGCATGAARPAGAAGRGRVQQPAGGPPAVDAGRGQLERVGAAQCAATASALPSPETSSHTSSALLIAA